MTATTLQRDLPDFSTEHVRSLVTDLWGLDGEFRPQGSERDLSYQIRLADGHSMVLKISNAAEPEGVVDLQVKALTHLAQRDPELPVPHMIHTRDGKPFDWVTSDSGDRHMIRMLSFLQGDLLLDTDAGHSDATRFNLGATMAKVAMALRNFHHPYAASNEHLWDLANCLRVRPLIEHLPDAELQRLCHGALDRFESFTLPRLQETRWQVLHQDAHSGNVLLNPDNHDQVTGIIDFGDMVFGPLVAEVAVAADTYHEADVDPIGNLCVTAAGFDSVYALEEAEVDLLYDMAVARMAVSAIIIGGRTHAGEDEGFVSDTGKFARLLRIMLDEGRPAAIARLREALRFPVYSVTSPADETFADDPDALQAKRHRVFGDMWHFYRQPMHFTRGAGAYLYTPDGRAYLDAYNNVPQIGHSHPHVVRAIARQAAALNTNTRYLCDITADYAERLTADLPDHLNTCIFVNSGSEANDFAMQIARAVTGNAGGIVMDDAYHGCTELTGALSPSAYHREAWIETLQIPDNYRGPYAGRPDAAERYAADAERALADLAARGHKPAVFMVDTALCSNGVTDVPEGYFDLVASKVKAAGGLVVADEVQAGCGRMGTFWGYRANGLHDANVDVITMGKPVGNGHPLGVVILGSELLARFQQIVPSLFSTFGGNTVACAAGMAVLDVIEREDLLARCNDTGDYLRAQLCSLAESQRLIGSIRGRGMMTGLEFVTDREAKTPATVETAALLELMRERGVLVGSEGKDRNILKLRPSMAWTRADVDVFIDALDQSLSALS